MSTNLNHYHCGNPDCCCIGYCMRKAHVSPAVFEAQEPAVAIHWPGVKNDLDKPIEPSPELRRAWNEGEKTHETGKGGVV